MITHFNIQTGTRGDPAKFATDQAPLLTLGEELTIEDLPVTHTGRKKHLTLRGTFKVTQKQNRFDKLRGFYQLIWLEPMDGATLEWTDNA